MKVSIGIPVYNCEAWIAVAIESALNQTWPDKEVIVVDDGSTDRTPEICARYQGRIIYARQEHISGNVARNHILKLASGEWIQYLDADDYLLPTKVEVQLNSIPPGTSPEAVFSPHKGELWRDGAAVHQWCNKFTTPEDPLRTFLRLEFLNIGAFLVRRTALQEIGGWDETLPIAEDDELWMRMVLNQWRFHYVNRPLLVWRRWSNHTWCHSNQKGDHLICASLIDRLQEELTSRGKWDKSLQKLADLQRFRLARAVAATDLPGAVACYLTPREKNLVRYPYATPSWKIHAVFRMLGFERGERFARALRNLRSPGLPRPRKAVA